MKVAIATVNVPFVQGGAEWLAKGLKEALLAYGHEADIISMPFIDSTPELIENHIVAARLMDINRSWGGRVDLCVGLKFPAYYMPHDNKVIWALHQHREAYDLFDTEYSRLKNNELGNQARRMIYNADSTYLREAKAFYTISQNVTNRLKSYSKIDSEALYHPCPEMEKFYGDSYDDYILMPSRINATKRQQLALEAMTKCESNVKLKLLGKAENIIIEKKVRDYIREHGLEDRVEYLDYVTQEEKFDLYAHAKAVLFIPKDEDYGYITLEGMASSRPVITMQDSGGPLEFLEHDVNGIICESSADALAEVLDRIWETEGLAEKLGEQARIKLDGMNIRWEHVVETLVSSV